MITNYIPDKTEQYPEGLDGIDRLSPRDREYAAWTKYVREFEKEELCSNYLEMGITQGIV